MDRGRHDHPAERPLDRRRQARVGMVEDGGRQHQALEQHHRGQRAGRAARSRPRGPGRTAPPRRNGSARHSRCRAARHSDARRGSATGAAARGWRGATSRSTSRAGECRRSSPTGPARKAGRRPSENPSAQAVSGSTSSGESRRLSPNRPRLRPSRRQAAAEERRKPTSSGLATAGRSRSHSAKVRAANATSAALQPDQAATSIQRPRCSQKFPHATLLRAADRFPNTGSDSGGPGSSKIRHPLCSARASDGQSTRSLTWRTCDA